MKINKDILFAQYKEIQKTCLEKGTSIPFIISPYHIPEKYKYSYYELKLINTDSEKLKQNEVERKRQEYLISNDKINKTLIEFWIEELRNFLNENPEFKDILIEDY